MGFTKAAIACVGCGCAGGACMGYAPAEAQGPLDQIYMGAVQIFENITGGHYGGNYEYGGQRWSNGRWG